MKHKLIKILAFFNPRKIRSRFFLAILLLSLPPTFLLGYISYNIAAETLVDNSIKVNNDHLKTSSDVADLLLEDMSNMHRLILSNSELRQDLIESGSRDNQPHKFIGVQTLSRLQNLVFTNLIETKYIDSICLFDKKFRYVCFGSPTYPIVSWSEENYEKIVGTTWYRKINEAHGKEVFFSYNVLNGMNTTNSFSSAKLLRDPTRVHEEPIGFLVININQSIFENIFNHNHQKSVFMVVDPSNDRLNTVYASDLMVTQETNSREDNLTSTIIKLENDGYLVSQHKNPTTGWTFFHVIEYDELFKNSARIRDVTTYIASLIGIVALVLSFIISDSITRPLRKLKKMMMKWSRGAQNFSEEFKDDEVGEIGNTFKEIATENKILSDRLFQAQLKEREAELKVLQAQIKPHFLYNTLDSIYWMAILEGHQDIAKIAVALSESFKLSLNNGTETILLSKELEHIKYYMDIQNIRFNNRFEYIENVDPGLLKRKILKLLLQPIVENAIYHGLEPKVGKGTIRLTGRIKQNIVVLTVEDDGVGFSNVSDFEKGYGLGNVRDRLKLYYGPSSSLTISSNPEKGTLVTISFSNQEIRD
ncbi:sensor histidine kinase [Bacillus solitudinis]|uniref:sensor histidine kinase n=1 Tax=Bacillus solitudinis TaxID=2014074 RepID=UPI000C23A565|nr:histidine kinase [Bacillus solitudinis]